MGNHCYNYMANEVYKNLTQNMVDECYKYTRDLDVTDKAHIVKSNLDKINEAFYKVHPAMSHSRKVSDDKIEEIEALLTNTLQLYHTFFPGKLIPKQHILHRHIGVRGNFIEGKPSKLPESYLKLPKSTDF